MSVNVIFLSINHLPTNFFDLNFLSTAKWKVLYSICICIAFSLCICQLKDICFSIFSFLRYCVAINIDDQGSVQ